jgi:hypothetical protein
MPGRVLADLSGLTPYMAAKVKNGTIDAPPKRRNYVPADAQWEKVERFMNEHPGETFTRNQLFQATGVPATTITKLFRERTGESFSESPLASEESRARGARTLGSKIVRVGAAREVQLPQWPFDPVPAIEAVAEETATPEAVQDDTPWEPPPPPEVAMFADYPLGHVFTVVGQSRQGAAIISDEYGNLFHPVRS